MSAGAARPRSIGVALGAAARALGAAGVQSPSLDARLLLGHVLHADQAALIRGSRERLADEAHDAFETFLDRRARGEPVSRILGWREFYGRSFALAPQVLDPRPDTETLVTAALALVAGREGETLSILDLGTGSGALIITLLAELADATGVGVDISRGAVCVARANARRHAVSNRCRFVVGDWDGALCAQFDLIVANPPYIPAGALVGLAREVREHDPLAALDGGPDGLDGHRAVAAAAARLLDPARGVLVVEIGAGQDGDAIEVLRGHALAVDPPAAIHRDLGGRGRVISARREPGAAAQK